ncbi:CD209 antigen-like protein C isoform X3 [Alosa sapidissima]|uniref:CD209 antigen-like protein C isoform X3 n=1 Tax=Alosa sapidissima TaxID=34773 RepID=UPI001C080E10|nr:CD209 antigen-like protein C isoform X3 [Alosa sapidissima]
MRMEMEDYNDHYHRKDNREILNTSANAGSNQLRACRIVGVSFGLLCLLQVTLNITLRLLYINNLTNDGQECQMGYGSLVEERDRLHKELDDLVGWKSFQSSLYFFSIEDRNWTMSRKDCRQRGADLVIINSKEEQEFISARVRDTWIGLTDSDIEGEWRWVDGTLPITKFWMENEPNNAVKGEDCVKTYGKQWNDAQCSLHFRWTCERQI